MGVTSVCVWSDSSTFETENHSFFRSIRLGVQGFAYRDTVFKLQLEFTFVIRLTVAAKTKITVEVISQALQLELTIVIRLIITER